MQRDRMILTRQLGRPCLGAGNAGDWCLSILCSFVYTMVLASYAFSMDDWRTAGTWLAIFPSLEAIDSHGT